MSTSISEIKRIVHKNPTELRYLFKSPTEDKRRLTRIISKLVPYRVGIEFETFGAVGQYLFPELCGPPTKELRVRLATLRSLSSTNKLEKTINDKICNKLGLVAFSEDQHEFKYESSDHEIVYMDDPQNRSIIEEFKYDMNEVRISISGYKQLITLYNALQVLNKCLIIPSINGGIHIHIDAPFVKDQRGNSFAVNWFNQYKILSEVLQIFEGYTGTYNKRLASCNKNGYVRVTTYPTIEFRIGRLTYDYPTLIRYIIKCSELVRRCKIAYESKHSSKDLVAFESNHVSNNGDLDRVVCANLNNDYTDYITRYDTNNGRIIISRSLNAATPDYSEYEFESHPDAISGNEVRVWRSATDSATTVPF